LSFKANSRHPELKNAESKNQPQIKKSSKQLDVKSKPKPQKAKRSDEMKAATITDSTWPKRRAAKGGLSPPSARRQPHDHLRASAVIDDLLRRQDSQYEHMISKG